MVGTPPPKGKRGRDADRAARAVSQARQSSGGRAPLIIGIAVVAVLAVVVAVGVALSGGGTPSGSGPIPGQRVAGSYPVSVQDGVVVAGNGPTVVEIYEDFLCPACGRFEEQHGSKIDEALAAGRITVRYHPVNLLDNLSRPPGYSLGAANAAICAADAGIYPSLHASLFGAQPREGGVGYTDDQLVALGRELGAPAGFEQCVRSGTHDAQVIANLAGADAALQAKGGFSGTPTVLLNGTPIRPLSADGAAAFDEAIGAPAG